MKRKPSQLISASTPIRNQHRPTPFHRLLSAFLLSVGVLFLAGTAFGQTPGGRPGNDCPPVTRLKSIYSNDAALRRLIASMFANVQTLPDGSPNFWKNKTIDDLYQFLNQWFYTLPTVSNGLDDILKFSLLYYHNPDGLKFVNEEPGLSWTISFVREQGRFLDSRLSTGSIPEWLADPSLHNEEYTTPAGGYTSFNQFFTRDLKPGMRSVARPDDNSIIVSPVDGVINEVHADLQIGTELAVKGRTTFDLNQLLGHSQFAGRFIGGTALSIILLPANYHHFHAPVSGRLVESREDVGNILFGSQLMDLLMTDSADVSVFEKYRHGYFILDTNRYGYVAVIPVGLETVGSVVFAPQVKDISGGKEVMITKGEELGHFAYGGSVVMMLFQKDRFNSVSVLEGQQIGIFNQRIK